LEALPTTMRAAVMYDVDDIRIEERPLPDACSPAMRSCGIARERRVQRRPDAVVRAEEGAVRVRSRARGNDRRVRRRPRAVDARRRAPFAIGDRVFAHHHAPCLDCDVLPLGSLRALRDVAFDESRAGRHVGVRPRIPRANLVDTLVLPANVSFADGSLVEPLACVVKSMRRAFPVERAPRAKRWTLRPALLRETRALRDRRRSDGTQMHVALGSAFGATVYASDFNAERLAARASVSAASATFAPPDCAREVARRHERTARGCGHLRPGNAGRPATRRSTATAADGTVLMFTPIEPDERFTFDQSAAYFRDLRLISSYSCGPKDTADSLALIARGTLTAARLGATEFPFPAVEPAYEAMRSADVLKAIVTFP
jgi:L-iditol 2-dehydrogenase